MKLRLFYIFCFVLLVGKGLSQENSLKIDTVEPKKNAIYGTLGVYIEESYGTLLGNYERMIFQLPNSFFQSFWFRIGAGPWVWWTGKGMNYVSTLSLLMGKRSAHIEIGSGVLFSYDSVEKKFDPLVHDHHLAGNLGFRYQKPGKNLVLRSGIGWPEFIYLSGGFCF